MDPIDESIEFLSKKGSGQLFTILDDDDPTSFGEIREQILISESTLSSRLKEGRELGLFQNLQVPSNEAHGNVDPYVLTDKGKMVKEVFRLTGITEHYRTMMETRPLIDQKKEIIKQLLRNEKDGSIFDDKKDIPEWDNHAENKRRNELRKALIDDFEADLIEIDEELIEFLNEQIAKYNEESTHMSAKRAELFSQFHEEDFSDEEDRD
jgi:DNA-binding HxlR family transcriptional regulator